MSVGHTLVEWHNRESCAFSTKDERLSYDKGPTEPVQGDGPYRTTALTDKLSEESASQGPYHDHKATTGGDHDWGTHRVPLRMQKLRKPRDRPKAASRDRFGSDLAALHDGVDIALRLHLVEAVLATTWVMRSSLFLSAPSSCSENLLHLAPMSLSRICLLSDGNVAVGARHRE